MRSPFSARVSRRTTEKTTGWRERAVKAEAWHKPTLPTVSLSPRGAPRPMKMGTIVPLWRYDSVAGDTLQLASLGCSGIQHYASWIPDIVGWSAYPSIAVISISLPDTREGPQADIRPLFDHLVRARDKRLRQVEAECLGGFQVDSEEEFRRLLDRNVS